MAIVAKRFNFLDEETNVSIADFFNSDNSSILNSPNNESKDITAALSEFIGNSSQSPNLKTLLGLVSPSKLRASKDILSNFQDTSDLSAKDLDKSMTGITGNTPVVTSAFSQLSTKCKSRAVGTKGPGKPYEPSLSCNGKERPANSDSCSANQFGTAVNKMTAGSYNFSYRDPGEMLSGITALSSLGYDMNMCGVFGALIAGNTNTNLLSRASSAVLGHLTTTQNTNGVLDLANSSAGLHPLVENPSGITDAMGSFKTPSDVKQDGYRDYSDRFVAAMELFDTDWDKSKHDNMLSVGHVDTVSSDLTSVIDAKVKNNIYGEASLNTAPSDNLTFINTALKLKSMSQF